MNNIEFYKHSIGKKEIRSLEKVLRSIFLTTGEVVYEFEERFSDYLGIDHTIGVMSCTAALHISLLAYDIGPGDEVITSPMSFVATPNSILHAGAIPVFVDVESDTGNIAPELIETAITNKTKAILPVHLYGQMCDMKYIRRIANKHRLRIIEDCAHCIEGEREGVKPGQLSDAACFSFYATKNITCGEGGAVCTNDEGAAERLQRLRLHGITKDARQRYNEKSYQHWDMDILGWKYNLDNIKAALLIPQLETIEKQWERRREIYTSYKKGLENVKGIKMPALCGKNALHLFTIQVNPECRDTILHKLQKKGVGVAVNYRAIHNTKFYRDRFGYKPSDFPKADLIGRTTISLPFYPKMTNGEIDFVIKAVRESLT